MAEMKLVVTMFKYCLQTISSQLSTKFPLYSVNLSRFYTDQVNTSVRLDNAFDTKMLEYLVCPLTKKPLEFDSKRNMLISSEIQVGYPIENGIPNLIPQKGIMLKSLKEKNE